MSSFEIIPGDAQSTVILHVPHSSTFIPADVRAGIVLTDEELAAELAAITDAHTDIIAAGAADQAGVRPWSFVNRTSRLVIDPERFPDEREELNAVGMGAVYEKTTRQTTLRTPTTEERADLIERFFNPYSEGIAALVRERLAAVGKVTIIDVHSFPVNHSAYELHKTDARPELCIGTDIFHTPATLLELTREAMRPATPTGDIENDQPFKGCYVPLDQYGSNAAVQAVMLEIRRDVVSSNMGGLQTATATLIDAIENSDRTT
ncbi:MAG: N-formylglutamate amidohydrolase [Actinomycetales bacterium]|nr:N-formylglutamate amidohydrolase [Actinomycetales bacterium]